VNKKLIRRSIFAFAVIVCVACWAYTFGSLALYGQPGVAAWTARVTVSAIATECVFWVGAFTVGWSLFERRRAILRKLFAPRRNDSTR
jgi:hypothetical protein